MSDLHQQARKLTMTARVEDISEQDRGWLESHLAECAPCAQAAAALEAAIGSVRGAAVTADARLVRATQMRVRSRAAELQQQTAAMRPLWIASALVIAYAALSTAAAWQVFALAGEWFRLTALSSRLVFGFFWIAPAIGASLLLLGCGSNRARWSFFAQSEIRRP